MLNIAQKEDKDLKKILSKEFKFEVDLESAFDLIPEVNLSQLTKTGNLNPGLLRQYVSGTKKHQEHKLKKL